MKRPGLVTTGVFVVLIGVAVWLLWQKFIDGPPSDHKPTPEDSRPDSKNPLPRGPLGVFKQQWNSRTKADWPVAEILAGISDETYLPPDLATVALKKRGFTEVLPVLDGSMACYVATGHEVAVVAFRGTNFNELNDWIVNLNVLNTSVENGIVHAGFSTAYAGMSSRIVEKVLSSRAKYVWITGHSLGGALALVCAHDFVSERNITVTGLMTYGQPRTGDDPFAEYINDKLSGRFVYFVNEDDIVPRIPPWLSHCGSLVWFKGPDRFRTKSLHMAARGRDKAPVVESQEEKPTGEVPALTNEQFADLKRRIEESRRPIAMRNERGEVVMRSTAGYIKDHAIKLYIEKVHAMLAPAATPPPMPQPLPTPIAPAMTVELVVNGSKTKHRIVRGGILEVVFAKEPTVSAIKDLIVKSTGGVVHVGNRPKLLSSGDQPKLRRATLAVYVRADGPGRVEITYKRGGHSYKHELEIEVTSP